MLSKPNAVSAAAVEDQLHVLRLHAAAAAAATAAAVF